MEDQRLLPKDQYQFQDPFLNFFTIDLINSMYNTLLFSEDYHFGVQSAEAVYHKCQLDNRQFILPHCQSYFNAQRLQLFHEAHDRVFSCLEDLSNCPVDKKNFRLTTLACSMGVIGTNFQYQVIECQPCESAGFLEKHVLKKWEADETEEYAQIVEEDVVLITSLFEPSESQAFLDIQ